MSHPARSFLPMVCLSCGRWGRGGLCRPCTESLRPGPVQQAGALVVASAFVHAGAARRLVHRLKYGGIVSAAGMLARAMAPLVPAGTAALVPVPRVLWRRVRYGVDPAWELAGAVSAELGVPVVPALRGAWFGPRHAGRSRSHRRAPMLTIDVPPPPESIVIDDVITTGTTLAAAAAVLPPSVRWAVTGTAAWR